MLIAVYALIALAVACAAWAFVPAPPSVSIPETALASTTGPSEFIARMKRGGVREFFSSLLSMVGKMVPRVGQANALRERLVYTGVDLTAEQLGGVKALAALAGVFIAFILGRELGHQVPLLVLALGAAVGFVVPDVVLRSRVRRRQQEIVRLLPEVIDILSLCVGAGLDFLAALNKVVLVKSFKREPLVEELSIVLQEIKLGKRRVEALRGVMKRVNVPEVSSFVRTLVQAERMGTPIAEVLSIHSEDIRFQRFTRAERMALKAPIKILVPLIFCIMPCVGIIVGAPIFLQFMHQNPFAQ